jgi:hypothetical protein
MIFHKGMTAMKKLLATIFFVCSFSSVSFALEPPVFERHDIGIPTACNAVGDFNKDGNLDIVLLSGHYTITPMLGQGNGLFTQTPSITCAYTSMVVAADVNNDGNLDILSDKQVHWGDGTGQFTSTNQPSAIVTINALAADVNNDTRLDIITEIDYKLNMLLGNGNGTFASPVLLSDITVLLPDKAVDLNHDGAIDIIAKRYYIGDEHGEYPYYPYKVAMPTPFMSVYVLIGYGNGTFQSPQMVYSRTGDRQGWSNTLNVYDFNMDGHLDIFYTYGNELNWFTGDGTGNFTLSIQEFMESSQPYIPMIADVNNDSIPDILALGNKQWDINYTDSLFVRYGNGDSTFQDEIHGSYPGKFFDSYTAQTVDANNDHYPDVIVMTSTGVSVFIQKVGASVIQNERPASMVVFQPYPNPFNNITTISYTMANPGRVNLSVYSITGQKIATLVDSPMAAGTHSAVFDGSNLASGIYLYRFESPEFAKTGKMLMVK